MATVDNVARLLALGAKGSGGGGTGGTSNYPDLANKPQINGVELVGNKTSEDLGIEPGVTEDVLTQALAAESAARQKQDDLLQGEIEGKIAAANILAGENIAVSQEGNNVTISSTAEGKTYTAGTNIEITEDSVINNTIPYNPEGTSDLSVVFGDKSYSLSGETVAIGAEARIGTDSPGAIAIGRYAEAGQGSTTVGTRSALTYNNDKYCVRIGYYQDGSSHHGDILIGANARPTNDEALIKNASIAIGANAKSTQTNQAIFGSEDAPINIMQYVSSEGVKTVATTDLIPEEVPIATTEVAGKVKPDGKTITVDAEGIIKALSGGEAIHVLRNNAEEPFILEDNEVGYYLLDLDTLGTTTQVPGDPKVFSYGATPNDLSIVTVRDETTFILLKYHTDIKSNQTSEEVPVLTKYDFDITQDSFPTIYMNEYTCSYKNGEYRTGFGSSQYFKIAGAEDLPEHLSELENDTGFITSEALNPLESNIENLEEQIKNLQTTSFEVVDELPTSDIKTNVIYLVPAQSSGIDNVYDEYIYTNNNWEKIGTTALDLSQYATKEYAEMVAANTINDTEVSDLTTYSSSKIESLSGIKVLTGTAEKPIIVSELETGNYVLSGTVQSSETNTTTQTLSKKVYTVEKGDSETVVWYENPKTHITYTYIFDTVGTNAPEEQNEIYITETQLKQAVIDGGNWA